jgi:uncharacterized RDD family membrane protein YckC
MSNTGWYVGIQGQQYGPMSLQDVQAMVADGRVQADTMVWCEGMADWVQARTLPQLWPAQVAQPAAPAYQQPYQQPYQQGGYAPQGQPGYGQPQYGQPGGTVGYYTPQPQIAYGGFWLRFVATFIDGLIIGVPIFVIVFFAVLATTDVSGRGNNFNNNNFVGGGVQLIAILAMMPVQWLYSALMESSSKQATLGKMAVGLKVTDLNGNPIGFGRATGRFFAKFLTSNIPLLGTILVIVSAIMIGAGQRKQGIHDHIASTLVLTK